MTQADAAGESKPTPNTNPLATPLLILGSCCPDDLPQYEDHFNKAYRSSPILDRFGRRVRFFEDSCRHVCYSKYQHDNRKDPPRDSWRPDRARRIPWIGVALAHKNCVLKQNKESGKENYLIAMQILSEAGMIRDYYWVVVKPRRGLNEVDFKTAYRLNDREWTDAMKLPSVRFGGRK